jgi:NhaP-type Na+/H+ or K+/H+ antiporter
VLSNTEIADMLCGALFGLAGGVIGFVVGGPGGALIGAFIGIGIFAALKTVDFIADGKYSNLLDQLATALTILAGAMIGFFVGGPAGAVIGAVVELESLPQYLHLNLM